MLELDGQGGLAGSVPCRTEVIAKLFGKSVRSIYLLTQEGILPTEKVGRGRKYDLVQTVQNYTRYLSEKAQGKSRAEADGELKQQKLLADIALKETQNELHRLKMDITAGRYIPVEEATLDYARFFVAFKRFALSLPGRLVSRVSGAVEPTEARRIEKELQGDVAQLLRAFVVAGVEEGQAKGADTA